MNLKTAIFIPVRLASTRFPNKPMVDILGKSMTQRVYEKALAAGIGPVFVACDGEEIAAHVRAFGGNAVITDPNLPSGTDRIYAATQLTEKFDVIINVQGDLPNIDPQVIRAACDALLHHECDLASVASKIKDRSEINNPNVVKVAAGFGQDGCGKALYFSRSPIPYSKDAGADYYHHIGIYAFKRHALEKFIALAPSTLEKRESLEQLRALENDMKIIVKLVDAHPLSVDTKEDLEIVIREISKNNP